MTVTDPAGTAGTGSQAASAAGPGRARRAAAPARVWTVPELLGARVAHDPDRVAIEVAGQDRITFGQWEQRSSALAAGLRDRGLRAGHRVALRFGTRDWVEYAIAYCGVLRAGGVAVPCSDLLAPAELDYLLEHSGAVGLVHAADAPPRGAGRWHATVPELERAGGVPETADRDTDTAVRPDDLAQIIYTSGTTGRPKGVAATHANLCSGATVHPRRRRLAHSEHFLHAFPVGTNAGQTMLLNALDARPTAVALGSFTPARFARTIATYQAGSVFLVPAMAIELLNSGALERHDTGSVVLLGSTAAALPPAVASGLAAAFPNAAIVNYYTSTEAAPAYVSMVFDPEHPAALGRPASGSLMIADADGTPVPAGTPGEVYLKAPFARSYYRDREATTAAFRDGWVRMGDIGKLDQAGFLYLLDRDQDVIKSGAWKVSTVQVEAALHEHPDIIEAAVVGLPHPVLGQVVGAGVVARTPLTPAQLREFLRDRIADHELPSRIELMDRLPRNPAGKVVKRELATHLTSGSADPQPATPQRGEETS